jgi:hypothetical protein
VLKKTRVRASGKFQAREPGRGAGGGEASTYDEGLPGPVRLRWGREPVGVGRAVAAGGGGGVGERGGGGAARVEAEPAEVGPHDRVHDALRRRPSPRRRRRRRAELAIASKLGGFDTGRRWAGGVWVGRGRGRGKLPWKLFM